MFSVTLMGYLRLFEDKSFEWESGRRREWGKWRQED